MTDVAAAAGPGVIVVAEQPIHTLLVVSGVSWHVEPCQVSVAQMWEGLSSGALSTNSRILIFSDSLAMGTSAEASELTQTAQAVVAMVNAGARVFIASSSQQARSDLWSNIHAIAAAERIEIDEQSVHVLDLELGARAVLGEIARHTQDLVQFPDVFPPEIDVILGTTSASLKSETAADTGLRLRMPDLPPIGGNGITKPTSIQSDELPASASRELLDRPKLQNQVTITVTSSKGGSGKSTASIMLAASIARASKRAGKSLSVCVVDLDTRDGQVASLIGRFMPTALNIRVQPVWDEERIRRNLVRADLLDIDCLLAPIRPRTADTVGPDFYRAIVRSLQRMYDVIVMDTSVQYLEPLIAKVALVEADEILFVTNLASTAVQGMARALREITAPLDESGLGIPREKLGIIINQAAANVGMETDQVLAAGLGMPVVGVVPLATRDVLTATNLNRMHELLDHPLIGPAYFELAKACLPEAHLAPWDPPPAAVVDDKLWQTRGEDSGQDPETERRRMKFRR